MAKKKAKTAAAEQKRLLSARDQELRAMLTDRRIALQTEIAARRREYRQQETSFADTVDAASDNMAVNNESALTKQKNDTLTKITDALARLEQGEYGNCTDCAGEISEIRLSALPFAVRCKKCQEEHEG